MTCEADHPDRVPVDAHRAIRQLERFLKIDTNAARDDQGGALSFDELSERASERSRTTGYDTEGERVVATIVYNLDTKEITIKRPGDPPKKT